MILENMHLIIHKMLDISARLRANYWQDLEFSKCELCNYEGESEL